MQIEYTIIKLIGISINALCINSLTSNELLTSIKENLFNEKKQQHIDSR